MRTKHAIIPVLAVLLAAPCALAAGRLFLNGVDITGVKDRSFKNVKAVQIDANGDIHMDAPQYEVKVMETGGTPSDKGGEANAAGLSGRYYLATTGPGKRVQYDLTIAVNGVERLVIKASDNATIEEITGWLQKGDNTILVTARKQLGAGRLSTAKDDVLTLMIGAGHVENKVVKIDRLTAEFKCDASRLSDFAKTYTLRAE